MSRSVALKEWSAGYQVLSIAFRVWNIVEGSLCDVDYEEWGKVGSVLLTCAEIIYARLCRA